MHIANWIEEFPVDSSMALMKELAFTHALRGGDQGYVIAYHLVCNDYAAVCDFEVDYSRCSIGEAANCRQALAFFSKCKYLHLPGVDPEATATVKFLEAEEACRATNELFELRATGLFEFEPWVESAFRRSRQKIARVLGELPKVADLKLHFGPGATTLTKKKNASAVEKLQAGVSCSESLFPYAARLLEEMPQLVDLHDTTSPSPVLSDLSSRIAVLEEFLCTADEGDPLVTVAKEWKRELERELWWHGTVDHVARCPVTITHGVVEFVPKTAKTHRSIVKEGSLNTMIQLALGDYMTKRLLSSGIDIKDQSRNKSLAKLGSLTGGLGTLDLSSASDTIAKAIVFELLPWDWAFMLESARSETVLLHGREMRLEKFSSMGNGYTFPLETLIFWALATSASEDGYASVYGDDIIVRTASVPRVMRLLEVCGFTVNRSKSYWTGSFRESCGGDYLSGIDIRPYYHKNVVTGMELFKLHNFFVRRHAPDLAEFVLQQIHPCLRIYGPDGFGDGHLIGDWHPRRTKRQRDHGYGGVLFDTFKLGDRKDFRPQRKGDSCLPTYSIYIRENGDPVLPDLKALPSQLEGRALAVYLGRKRFFETGVPAGLSQAKILGTPIPERVSPVDGRAYKLPSLPGVDGYRRVSIYTFDPGR